VAKDGKHRDAAMLDLDVTKSIKSLLVGIVQQTKRIPETKRGLHTELVLEAHLQGGGGLGHTHLVGGDEGGG
ncbi:unnamed protein product, partial [Heterosigma akashiwo]